MRFIDDIKMDPVGAFLLLMLASIPVMLIIAAFQDPEPPLTRSVCVKSEVEMEYWCPGVSTGGIPMGAGCEYRPMPKCIQSIDEPNPDHDAWERRHQK